MQRVVRVRPRRGRRWKVERNLEVSLPPERPDLWLPLVGQQLQASSAAGEVVLDMSRVEIVDMAELSALARILENLRAEGRSLTLSRLQPGPLSLLQRLGLTQFLGVTSGSTSRPHRFHLRDRERA